MKAIVSSIGISRRFVLSTLAVLPALVGPLRPTSALAQMQTDQLPSWNDGPVKTSILHGGRPAARSQLPCPASRFIGETRHA